MFQKTHTSSTAHPFYHLTMKAAPPPQVTLAAYGYMAQPGAGGNPPPWRMKMKSSADLLVPTQLAPFELDPLFDSVRRTGRLLAVEEGTLSLGWGAEVLARSAEALGPVLKVASRLAARETVISPLPPHWKRTACRTLRISSPACEKWYRNHGETHPNHNPPAEPKRTRGPAGFS